MAANRNLKKKAVDLLHLLGMPYNTERWEQYEELVRRYGQKPVDRKLDELARRGYVEYGSSPRAGWLTEKGVLALMRMTTPDQP